MTSIEGLPPVNPNIIKVEVVDHHECYMCGSPYVVIDEHGRVQNHENEYTSRCQGSGLSPRVVTKIIQIDLSNYSEEDRRTILRLTGNSIE